MPIQLRLPRDLPGADWASLPQYQGGHSCPARICVGGVVLEYVEGSLMDGRAEYREVTG